MNFFWKPQSAAASSQGSRVATGEWPISPFTYRMRRQSCTGRGLRADSTTVAQASGRACDADNCRIWTYSARPSREQIGANRCRLGIFVTVLARRQYMTCALTVRRKTLCHLTPERGIRGQQLPDPGLSRGAPFQAWREVTFLPRPRTQPRPTMPNPSRAREAGSGTAASGVISTEEPPASTAWLWDHCR